MDDRSGELDNQATKKPRIIRLGSHYSQGLTKRDKYPESIFSLDEDEIRIDADNWDLQPNQRAELQIHSDGILEITALQEESTPGARLSFPINLEPGNYTFTVIGHADTESIFFPWAMDEDNIRLTPTAHIPTVEEPTSVHFKIKKETRVFFGVLSHNQRIGDKCYIQSFHISKNNYASKDNSAGSFKKIQFDDLIPHQKTELDIVDSGIKVTSTPISTPGSFAEVEVTPSSTITLFIRVSITYPSVAFLYIADTKNGDEIIKRNVIFESSEEGKNRIPSELYTSAVIPKNVSSVRIGLLFSTVSQPEIHEMVIHDFEIVEHRKLGDVIDEAYVINMAEDKEKFEFCKHQADRFDFLISRWEAVNGSLEPHLSEWNEYMESPWTEMDKRLGRKAIDKKGAWGYLLSIREILSDAVKKGHNSIAIFDDDFILTKSFDHDFSKLIEIIGSSWDIIYLGASQWLWDGIQRSETNFYRPNQNTNGSFAVLYNRSSFQPLIEDIDSMQAPFDAGPLRNFVLGDSADRCFVAYPNIAIANLEKPGIRESRNQREFSKRFGWDLDQFPPWFSSWSPTPIILLDSGNEYLIDGRKNFVTAVTTVNRKQYLQQFVSEWAQTKSPSANSTLIVADDGSTDGTLEWLTEELDLGESRLIVIRNNGTGIARQTNSILNEIINIEQRPDSIFMCNDDIRFRKQGWDDAYYSAMKSSGFDHLVYFNAEWKPASQKENSTRSELLVSHCTAREAMGCFYTLTPELITKLGFFDEDSFPVRGHSHVDYTIRACRAEANDIEFLFDLVDSNEFIGMVMRDGYKRTFRTLSVKEMKQTTSNEALLFRESVLLSEDRVYVSRGW